MTAGKSCLITGGAGFIGLHLARRLLRDGHSVTIVDHADPEPDAMQGMNFIRADIAQEGLLERLAPLHDCVFHLAALLGVRRTMTGTAHMIENNLIGTMKVLQAAKRTGSKVIFASTSEVYGKAEPPFREDGDIVYGTPAKLRWSYALAKSLEESLCLGYVQQGLAVTIVRYFNVYGPRQKEGLYGGVIPRFIKAALEGKEIPVYGDGTQTRSFTYVDDAVEMTVRAAFDAGTDGQIVNIGSDREIPVLQLADLVKSISQSPSPIVYVPFEKVYPNGFEEIPRRRPSTEKIASALRFTTETPLEEGLDHTIRWYRQVQRELRGDQP